MARLTIAGAEKFDGALNGLGAGRLQIKLPWSRAALSPQEGSLCCFSSMDIKQADHR